MRRDLARLEVEERQLLYKETQPVAKMIEGKISGYEEGYEMQVGEQEDELEEVS